MRKIFFLIIFTILVFGLQAEINKISEIKVIGNKYVPKEEIIAASGLYEGEYIQISTITDAIKKVMKEKKFDDIKIYKEETENGVRVIIEVKEAPLVKFISIKGNEQIATKSIIKVISNIIPVIEEKNNNKKKGKHQKGEKIGNIKLLRSISVSESDLGLMKIAIEKLYRDKMIDNVNVVLSIEHIASKENLLMINIEEGQAEFIERIDFDGNNNFSLKKLRSVISTKPKNSVLFWEKGKIDYSKITEDIIKIEQFYHNNGFPFAKVVSHEIKKGDKGLVLVYTIDEGRKVFINNITTEGITVIKPEYISKFIKIKKGDVYSEEKIDKTVSSIQDFYMNLGYMTTTVNYDKSFGDSTCDIHLSVVEGNIITIRNIIIKGNKKTHDEVIRREIILKPGDVFSKSKLVASYRRLYQLQIFDNVEINPVPVEGSEDLVDLVFMVNEKQSSKITGGLSWSEDAGAFVNISLSLMNVFGYNRTFALALNVNQTYQNVSFSFNDPNIYYGMMFWGFSIYYTEGERDFYRETKFGGNLGMGRSYIPGYPYLHINGRYISEYFKREFSDTTEEITTDSLLNLAIGKKIRSGFSSTIMYDSRNHYLIPDEGYMISITGEWYGGVFQKPYEYAIDYLSNYMDVNSDDYDSEDYQKYVIDARSYKKIKGNFSLMNRLSLGVVDGYSSPETVPVLGRFILGGTGLWGIRGFPDRSIGVYSVVSDISSYVIGGRFAAVTNMELRYKFNFEDIPGGFALLFLDIGNTWENFTVFKNTIEDSISNGDYSYIKDVWKYGYGIGGRIEIPGMGIMGLDIGYSPQYKEVIPHFQMGFTF